MHVPVIDFAAYDSEKPESLSQLGGEVGTALTVIGFMSITNLGSLARMLRDVFSTSREFFASSVEHKMKSAYLPDSKNFVIRVSVRSTSIRKSLLTQKKRLRCVAY